MKELDINNDICASILNCVEKEDGQKIAQPHVVIGESGSGKTFLLNRLHVLIEGEPHLRPVFIEGKTLFSTNDMWKHCTTLEDTTRRIVLLIDNIQYYFERTDNGEQFNLRGRLNKAGAPILIATADKVLQAFTNYDAAFFDAFKVSYIRPLNNTNYEKLMNSRASIVRLEKLMGYLPKTIRSLQLATMIITESPNEREDLAILTDHHALYYETKYNGYVSNIQRILSAMASAQGGVTLKELRETTGLDNGRLSPYLKLMLNQRIIDKTSKTQRGGTYSISDPLFRHWLRGRDL